MKSKEKRGDILNERVYFIIIGSLETLHLKEKKFERPPNQQKSVRKKEVGYLGR